MVALKYSQLFFSNLEFVCLPKYLLVAQGRYCLWNALDDGCSGTGVNVLEYGDVRGLGGCIFSLKC